MAVIFIGEDPGGRRARNSAGLRSYTRVFKLKTTTKTESAYAVGSNASLPIIGSLFPDDSDCWCHSIDVENNEPWAGWRVTAEYNSENEISTDPTADPARIKWNTEQFQREAVFDINDYPILNSAGDPPDPPLWMDDTRRSVTVTKNMASVPSWIISYQDSVNSDTFSVGGVSIAVGVAKLQRVEVSELMRRNGVPFYEVQFDIQFQRDGWLLNYKDVGFRAKVGTQRKVILSDWDLAFPPTPTPLDGSGAAVTNPSETNTVYRSKTVYVTNVFSGLPLT